MDFCNFNNNDLWSPDKMNNEQQLAVNEMNDYFKREQKNTSIIWIVNNPRDLISLSCIYNPKCQFLEF